MVGKDNGHADAAPRQRLSRRLQERLAGLSEDQRAVLERTAVTGPARRSRRATSTMDFSLFFFSADGHVDGAGKYRLLLDCARHADTDGFAAIWVPERHFVEFGGLYPNPVVLAAAIATITERVQIRAGSVVVPLHHPVRLAEDWAVVDNLSGGRVGISCASGWHQDDFVLAPGRDPDLYARRKDEMFTSIDIVQRLWAGESVTMARPDGTAVAVRTLPRPLQRRLPVWITSQGSVETFVGAGAIGANVLCGLIGHRLGDLAQKIDAYRSARQAHGFAADAGRVSVMLHTFLGPSDDEVRALVRQPLMRYLRTFLAQDPAESGFTASDRAEREAALAATFEHYFDHAGLLGTPDKCEALVEDLVDAGVDEVACLVDFGLPGEVLKDGLRHLSQLKDRYRR